MRRWLLGKDDAVVLDKIVVRTEEELRCTEKGQVLLLPGERSVFDLNVEIEKGLADKRQTYWQKTPKAEALEEVRKRIGMQPLKKPTEPRFTDVGRVDRDDYHIDKFVLQTDSGVPLPGLTYHPQKPRDEAYLYLHEDGKLADGAPGSPIEKLVKDGFVVVAVDLRGIGETAAGKPDALLGDWKNYYLAYLLGQSLVGLHTEDTLTAGNFVAYYKTKTPRKVHLVAVGRAGIPALHAAALAPEVFTSITLRQPLESWSSIVGRPVPSGLLPTTVHGALQVYDLPDLVRVVGAEKLKIDRSK